MRALKGYFKWHARGYAAPNLDFIKSSVLLRNESKNATWVEAGTSHGDTTIVLAGEANFVYTIEASEFYAARATERF